MVFAPTIIRKYCKLSALAPIEISIFFRKFSQKSKIVDNFWFLNEFSKKIEISTGASALSLQYFLMIVGAKNIYFLWKEKIKNQHLGIFAPWSRALCSSLQIRPKVCKKTKSVANHCLTKSLKSTSPTEGHFGAYLGRICTRVRIISRNSVIFWKFW